ncbi:DUF1365 domain-containing protein [Catenulispora pinistramenti]|uniref:DUF1365 domain-containing protein n=1 Tax=Catenulispora pinistramenti TaxID=2705254 RepID=UPI001E37F9D4|nr:DUF1365 domain-containing protein [Catenulispora pinistramenti]
MVNSAALYECRIRHVRRGAVANDFTYSSYLWLVDLDAVPRLPGPLRVLAGFRPTDHFTGSDRTIRAGLEAFLAENSVSLGDGRVLMLTAARVFGYVFNPLTVYWCHDTDDRPVCVVAEVHNTYGGRHAYLLFPDDHDQAEVAKDFYVSPFLPIDGATYRMRLPEPGERLSLAIRLELPGAPPFVAGVHGTRHAATISTLLRTAARHPLAPLAVAARIRRQGLALFLRGLPVLPRPRAHRRSARTRSLTKTGGH